MNGFIKVYREQARVEQNSECYYCYEPLTFRTATADHIVPQKKHGNHSRKNIAACCAECNQAKGHMSEGKFIKLIKSFPSEQHYRILLCWSRRRINLALKRLSKKVLGI